ITELGIGEALVSFLEGNGTPARVERCLIRPPGARLGPITAAERKVLIAQSPVGERYDHAVDSESAYERLRQRVDSEAAGTESARTAGEIAEADEGGGFLGDLFGTNRKRG